jgi:hypothetical protein
MKNYELFFEEKLIMSYVRSTNSVSKANEQHEVNNGEAEQLSHCHIVTLTNYELFFAERLLPVRDSASSPLERGQGVCYSLKQGFIRKIQSIFRNFFNYELFRFAERERLKAFYNPAQGNALGKQRRSRTIITLSYYHIITLIS